MALDGRREPTLVVGSGQVVAAGLENVGGVAHHDGTAHRAQSLDDLTWLRAGRRDIAQTELSLDSMVSEMRDFVSYFEDLAKSNASKISEYKDKLKEVADRLTRLFE